jgi:hypothetical protein
VSVRKLTLTASLGAFYGFLRLVPIAKIIGVPNGSITAAGMIAPLLGFMLEPWYAVAAVTVGTFAAGLAPWNTFPLKGLDFLPGCLNVLTVSLLVRGRRVSSIIVYLAILALFVVNPFTLMFVDSRFLSPPIPYIWMHLVAFAVLISPLSSNLQTRLTSFNARSVSISILALAFVGTMIEHLTGGIVFASIYQRLAVGLWRTIFLVYPIERTILVVGAILICTPTLLALRSSIMRQLELESRTRLSAPTIPASTESIE